MREHHRPGTIQRRPAGRGSRFSRRAIAAVPAALAAVGAFSPRAFAQCAMCGLSAGQNTEHAWFAGVMMLLVPAAAIVAGIAWVTWKYRK